jgi:hypothetical protein
MSTWHEAFAEVERQVSSITTSRPWFRGHCVSDWKLLPTLARCRPSNEAANRFPSDDSRERGVYSFFVREAGGLIDSSDPWSVAVSMQHHGIPTRLLDWTTTFAVALYFALKDSAGDAAVWILQPFRLNEILIGRRVTLDVDEFDGNYADYFIRRSKTPPAAAVALDPPWRHPRLLNQRGGFTLHADLITPLEELAAGALHKIIIPQTAHKDAWRYLKLSGISEFSLFPDLDGLARDLRTRFF